LVTRACKKLFFMLDDIHTVLDHCHRSVEGGPHHVGQSCSPCWAYIQFCMKRMLQ
jgi:hypothetical protein